jgi:hypothetical protein
MRPEVSLAPKATTPHSFLPASECQARRDNLARRQGRIRYCQSNGGAARQTQPGNHSQPTLGLNRGSSEESFPPEIAADGNSRSLGSAGQSQGGAPNQPGSPRLGRRVPVPSLPGSGNRRLGSQTPEVEDARTPPRPGSWAADHRGRRVMGRGRRRVAGEERTARRRRIAECALGQGARRRGE